MQTAEKDGHMAIALHWASFDNLIEKFNITNAIFYHEVSKRDGRLAELSAHTVCSVVILNGMFSMCRHGPAAAGLLVHTSPFAYR